MKNEIIDLNSTSRASVDLKLGGKTFHISRVVMGVRRLYGELVVETGQLLEKVGSLKEAEGEELEKLSTETEDLATRNQDRLFKILRLLLIKNGYKYNREWWEDNADDSDLRTFILSAINKDVPNAQKKSPENWQAG